MGSSTRDAGGVGNVVRDLHRLVDVRLHLGVEIADGHRAMQLAGVASSRTTSAW